MAPASAQGDRVGTPAQLADDATWTTVSVTRYGGTAAVKVADRVCLWYGTWRTDTVRVVLLRDTRGTTTPHRVQNAVERTVVFGLFCHTPC